MSIIGHGIDIVKVKRIARSLEKHGPKFLDRCFCAHEQAYADANPKRRAEHLAGRFAAKEAVLKAIGTGWRDGIAWTDIEIVLLPSGQPTVKLSGETQRIAENLKIDSWHVSISHTSKNATASAIAESSSV